MKKISIIFILISLILGIVAVSGMLQATIPINMNQSEVAIKNYKHNPDNLLDNIFMERDHEMIIPIIFEEYIKNSKPQITMEKLTSEFQKKNMTIKTIENNDSIGGVGTGTKITTFQNSNLYEILIYGDVNGDGNVNLSDARRIVNYVINQNQHPLTGIKAKAADLANDGTGVGIINLTDARRIVNFVVSNEKLLIVEPTALAEIDSLESISLLQGPTTSEYNYGTTSIDFTGTQIQLNWKSGKKTTAGVTNDMITTSDVLTTPGTKTYTVTYEGFTTTFTIKVLNKIEEIEITNSVEEGIYEISNGYKGYVNEIFHLGVLQSVDKGDTSKLEIGQIKPENLKIELISSTDADATTTSLEITPHVNESGNIVLYGNATKNGIYKVTVSIDVDGTKVELPINIEITQNEKIDRIEVTPNTLEVKAGEENAQLAEVKVFNVIGELINSADITITNNSEGIKVTKLNSEMEEVGVGESVKYILVSTTITEPQNIEFAVNAIPNNSAFEKKSANVSVSIKEEPYVAEVIINSDEITLYTEEQEGITAKLPGDDRIYTVLPIEFKDQDGKKINVTYNQIQSLVDPDDIEKGKLGIISPMVKFSINGTTQKLPRSGVEIKYFTGNELDEAIGGDTITKIGIAVSTYTNIIKINLGELNTKSITFVTATNTLEKQIHVVYTENVTMKIVTDENVQRNLYAKQDTSHDYVVYVGEKFVLGKVTTDGNIDEIALDKFGVKEISDGLSIEYEKDNNGNILVTGTASKENIYRVTPVIKDGVAESSNSVTISAINKVDESEVVDIEFIDDEGDLGYTDWGDGVKDYGAKLMFKKPDGSSKQITLADIEATASDNKLEIGFYADDTFENPLEKPLDSNINVQYILISNVEAGETYTITFKINGKEIPIDVTMTE